MITERQKQQTEEEKAPSTLGDRMQSGGFGRSDEDSNNDPDMPAFDVEEINIPGELLPGGGLRLSNTPDSMPELITSLRKLRGLTQAELGEAIGYPAPVIGNIEQGRRKLGLKTLGDLFNALGGDLYIEYREK